MRDITIELAGKYVRLVPLKVEHAEALVEAANISRQSYRYTLVPTDLPSAISYIENLLELKQNGEAYPFATLDQNSGKIVGSTRFMSIEYWNWPGQNIENRDITKPDILEIGGTWLSEPFQRTGINTEAKLLMLKYAFEELGVHRVSLKTDARNEKSRRNIERVGAKFDGILRAHMPSYDHGIRNTAFYSILKEEWPEVRDRLSARLR